MGRLRAERAAAVALLVALAAACAEEGADPGADAEPPPQVYRVGGIEVIDPWAKSAIGDHDARLFFEFRNTGEADRLISARSPIAAGETRFRLVVRGDAGREVRSLGHIEIPTTDTPFELTEIGYYVELLGVQVPLTMGKELPVTLEFERAGRVDVVFPSRFHSPSLGRRIRAAARSGDLETLRALRDASAP